MAGRLTVWTAAGRTHRARLWAFVAICAHAGVLAASADTGPAQGRGHARVMLSAERAAELRNRIGHGEDREAWEDFRSRIRGYDAIGEWYWHSYVRLIDTAFAATVTGDADLAETAKYLLGLACVQDKWCHPRNEGRAIPLHTAETGAAVALAYDWLFPLLSDEEKDRVQATLERMAFEPYAGAVEEGSYPIGRYTDNWCAVVSSGVGIAGAILADRSEAAGSIVPRATAQISGVLDELEKGNGWAEGVGYWGYTLESILKYTHVLEDTGFDADTLLEHDGLADAVDFPLYLHLGPGAWADISDCRSSGPSRAPLLRLAGLTRDGHAQWLAEQSGAPPRWCDLIWRDREVPATRPEEVPRTKLFDRIQWAVMGSGWGPEDMVMVLSSGYRTAHSHLDANHILLHAYGETLLGDLGRKGYPEGYFSEGGRARCYWSDTRGHNAILMDGVGQVCQLGRGSEVTHFLHGRHCDYVRSDATATYPPKANRVVRHIVFVRPEYFFVIDQLDAQWKTAWEWLGHSSGGFSVGSEGCTIRRHDASLRLEVVEPRSFEAQTNSHPGGEQYVSFSSPRAVQGTRFAIVLYPWQASERDGDSAKCPAQFGAEYSDRGASVTVRRPDGTTDELVWTETDSGELVLGVVTREAEGGVSGFSGFNTRRLRTGEQLLAASDGRTWVSADLDGEIVHAAVVVKEGTQSVAVWCPRRPGSMMVDGDTAQWGYDAESRLLQGLLGQGQHQLVVKLENE